MVGDDADDRQPRRQRRIALRLGELIRRPSGSAPRVVQIDEPLIDDGHRLTGVPSRLVNMRPRNVPAPEAHRSSAVRSRRPQTAARRRRPPARDRRMSTCRLSAPANGRELATLASVRPRNASEPLVELAVEAPTGARAWRSSAPAAPAPWSAPAQHRRPGRSDTSRQSCGRSGPRPPAAPPSPPALRRAAHASTARSASAAARGAFLDRRRPSVAFEKVSAGARPNSTVERTHRRAPRSQGPAHRSGKTSNTGRCGRTQSAMKRTPNVDSHRPNAPAMAESTRLSTRSCRDDPPAGGADRGADGELAGAAARNGRAAGWRRWRRQSAARTRGAEDRKRGQIVVRTGRPAGRRTRTTVGLHSDRSSADTLGPDSSAIVSSSALAWSAPTPLASRPNTSRAHESSRACVSSPGSTASGSHRPSRNGNSNPSRHHADDGRRRAVDEDRSAENRGDRRHSGWSTAGGRGSRLVEHRGDRRLRLNPRPSSGRRRECRTSRPRGTRRPRSPVTRPGSLIVIRPPANAASDAKLRESRRTS